MNGACREAVGKNAQRTSIVCCQSPEDQERVFCDRRLSVSHSRRDHHFRFVSVRDNIGGCHEYKLCSMRSE